MTALDHPPTAVAPATDDWLRRDEAALAAVLPRSFDLVAARGEGSWLIDVDGRRFLDLTSGIGVTNVGHCHPRVVAAVQAQAADLLHTSVVVHHPRSIELAERIGALTPFFDEPQVFFANTGAEVVDGAIKLARYVTGRPGIVAFRRAFHGRTIGGTSLTTAKPMYQEGYQPLLPGVATAPYAIPGDHPSPELAVERSLAELDAVLAAAPADQVAALVVEPVLGEGGYVVPPDGWLAGLRQRCDRHGILLVFDEVQCGMGRTGRPFAAEVFDVAPDVVLFAKGVAAGLPLGGIVAPRALLDRWPTGAHGTTFGGNPVSCAAALASLAVLEDEGLYERARVLGDRARARLRDDVGSSPAVVDVRGIGLMIGLELADGDVAGHVQDACLASGVLVLTCGPHSEVLRLIPPLTISDEELDRGLDVLVEAVGALSR